MLLNIHTVTYHRFIHLSNNKYNLSVLSYLQFVEKPRKIDISANSMTCFQNRSKLYLNYNTVQIVQLTYTNSILSELYV